MATVAGSIRIERSAGEVFDLVVDERNEPLYNPALLSAVLLTDEPVRVGSRFRAMHSTRRGSMEMTVELTECEPPRRISSVTRASWADIEGSVTFQPEQDGTRMSWSWHVRPKGVAKVLTPFIGVVGRREERACWEGLKRYMEG